MRTGLSVRGYWALKADLGEARVAAVKEELTMVPIVAPGAKAFVGVDAEPVSFELFRDGATRYVQSSSQTESLASSWSGTGLRCIR